MCMGGGQAATITMPDTGAYDRMANMQMQAMRDQMSGQSSLQQAKLNSALTDQQGVKTQLADVKTQRAKDTAANAARLAALIGTPPPEKAATAPTVGTNRSDVAKASGKKGLRIERSTPTTQAAGTGLNITTGA